MRRGWRMAALGLAGTAAAALAVVCLTSGCASVGYYGQAIGGHLGILGRQRPISDWLADAGTPPDLRARLELVQRLRDFAVAELKLPDNRSYRGYADLQRGAAVWNVVAAPELSLALKTWCFPIMGCVGYRGYFDRAAADALGAQLQAEGWEVSVYGVPAYSTLGWSNWLGGDPMLNTFVHWPEGDLARLLFHELAHQVAYAADDTMFNESFATAVERIGAARWLARDGAAAARAEYELLERRREDFRRLTLRHRERLDTLYREPLPDAVKRTRKAELRARLDEELAQVRRERWNGYDGYDAWFAKANNAAFAVQAAYNELVPAFERLFEAQGRDFSRFYAEVARLAALPRAERRAALGGGS